jgi:DNA-binding XRE family transcriptional regulator
MYQTTPFSIMPPIAAIISTGIGTGGYYTLEHYNGELREAGLTSAPSQNVVPAGKIENVTEILANIQSVLKLTTTELADCLGVTRQAIYNWKAGSEIKDKNASKIENLMAAARVILSADIQIPTLSLKRKLAGGKTLFEMILTGSNGDTAAHALIKLLRKESEQRKMLSERFANRKPVSIDQSDYGIPSFDES